VLFRGDEMYLWVGDDGVLVEHKQGDLETRYDMRGRLASRGRWATLADGRSKRPHDEWEYGFAGGPVRRRSTWEYGVERSRVWLQHGLERAGAIAQIATGHHPIEVEVGAWTVRDASGAALQTVELERAYSDDELLAHPAMNEAAVDAEALSELAGAMPIDAPALCAWIRLAARVDVALLARITVRPERWSFIPHSFPYWHDGEPEALGGGTLAARLQAIWWGAPCDEVVEAAGIWLAERGRPRVALDFFDVVTALRGVVSAGRATCLIALAREDEAELPAALTPDEAILHGRLAERGAARELAALIAAKRGGPTTLANAARARLLSAYADGKAAPTSAFATFVRSLPERLRHYRRELAAGFSESGRLLIDAEDFLAYANDLARLFPAAIELDLTHASGAMGRLASCPAIGRYRRLHLVDTYLFDGGAAHLAGSRYISQLEELGLYGTSLYDEDLHAILASRHLRSSRARRRVSRTTT
jgi:hypothetical protein